MMNLISFVNTNAVSAVVFEVFAGKTIVPAPPVARFRGRQQDG